MQMWSIISSLKCPERPCNQSGTEARFPWAQPDTSRSAKSRDLETGTAPWPGGDLRKLTVAELEENIYRATHGQPMYSRVKAMILAIFTVIHPSLISSLGNYVPVCGPTSGVHFHFNKSATKHAEATFRVPPSQWIQSNPAKSHTLPFLSSCKKTTTTYFRPYIW